MNIILVWAGGTGISSLGFLLTELWYTNIIWIDAHEWQIVQELQKSGVKICIWHGQYNVQAGDLVVYSDAAPQAPEVLAAKEFVSTWVQWARHPLSYFQFLGEISKLFKTISIAGTHGKSTTSAMLTYTMSQSFATFWLGILWALVPQLDNKNYRSNPTLKTDIARIFTFILTGNYTLRDESLRKKYYFVIEADEFNRHFLYLDTDYAIILNAELDHSDIYPNEQVYLDTFIEFAHKVKKEIFVLAWEKWVDYLCTHWPSHITKITQQAIDLPYIFGDHVQKNASLNKALLDVISNEANNIFSAPKSTVISSEQSESRNPYETAMSNFKGLRRRMELLKEYSNWWLLYTDYGHHPTEIKAVLNAFRQKFPTKKLVAIFQPHQARRVLEFWDGFAQTMQWFNENIIYNIYMARENLSDLLQIFPLQKDYTIDSSEALGKHFAHDCNAIYVTDFSMITKRIEEIKDNEIICLFTAWDLDFSARKYLSSLS